MKRWPNCLAEEHLDGSNLTISSPSPKDRMKTGSNENEPYEIDTPNPRASVPIVMELDEVDR